MRLQALVVVKRQSDGRRPQHPLSFVLREPQLAAGDDLGVYLRSVVVAEEGNADQRGGQARELILKHTDLAPTGESADALYEGAQAIFDLDDV